VIEPWHIRCAGFGAAVDAFAQDDRELWFLSLLGNQQSVRALWARLLKREFAVLSEEAFTGGRIATLATTTGSHWRFHVTRLPATGATHAILVPEVALYAGEGTDFLLLARDPDEAPALHYRYLTRRLDVPLHRSWTDWLWERALAAGETRALDARGIHAWRCVPDPDALAAALGRALRGHRIAVPASDFAVAA